MFGWFDHVVAAIGAAVAADGRNLLWVWGLGLATLIILVGVAGLLVLGAKRSYRHYKTLMTSKNAQELTREEEKIDPFTLGVTLVAFTMAGQGMWEFFGHQLGLAGNPLRWCFLVLELFVLARARAVRIKARKFQPAGVDAILIWAITIASGLMSASDAETAAGWWFRFGMPILAAIGWELSLNGVRAAARERARERLGERARERARGVLKLAPQQLLARLGLLDASGREMSEVIKDRLIDKLALVSVQVHDLKEADAWAVRLWWARKRRSWRARAATVHAGLGSDPETTRKLRAKIAALKSLELLSDINPGDPWQVPVVEYEAEAQVNPIEPPKRTQLKAVPKPPKTLQAKVVARSDGSRVNGVFVPQPVLDFCAEAARTNGQLPLTSDLKAKFDAGESTARRWRQALASADLETLASGGGSAHASAS